MSLKAWLFGLLSGVIASAANAGSGLLGAMVLGPELLHDRNFWKVMCATALFAGLKTALAWLKQSPLPAVLLTTETVTTVKTTSTDPAPAVPDPKQ
jgi:phosphoglycolate phosphatase-like HAD superfamily hydrolase